MQKWKWKRLKFTIFHSVIAALMLAMSVVGMTMVEWCLFVIGWTIVIFGLLSFFPNLIINIEVLHDIGVEIIETNLGERLIAVGITVLIGAAIAQLPTLIAIPISLVFIAVAVIAIFLGSSILSENRRLCLYDDSQTMGKFIPLAYIAAGAIFMISGQFGPGAEMWVRIAAMVPAVAYHVYRTVYVFREGSI